MILINQSAQLLDPKNTEEGIAILKAIEHAGRNCYASYDKVNETSYIKFIESLIKRGHTAPLEFGDMTFAITTSRAVLAELTRHRLSSFCVESQRYIQEAKTGDITFVKPEWYLETTERSDSNVDMSCKLWEHSMAEAETIYKNLSSLGKRPEEAREVLPNSTACRIVMKANVREWRHIFSLRCDKAAYPQMRSLATIMLKQAHETIPVAFDDLYKQYTEIKGVSDE